MTEEEATARAVNAEPWEPPPGMVKRQCPECRYFFATAPLASAVADVVSRLRAPEPSRAAASVAALIWLNDARLARAYGIGRCALPSHC